MNSLLKRFVRFLFLFSLLLIVVYGTCYVILKSRVMQITIIQNSDIGNKIRIINPVSFYWWLDRLGYKKEVLRLRPLSSREYVEIDSISFFFTDQVQPFYKVKNPDGSVAVSADFVYQESEKDLRVSLYVNSENKFLKEFAILDVLFRMQSDKKFENQDEAFGKLFTKYRLKGLFFLGKNFNFVKQALADCSGSFRCCTNVTRCGQTYKACNVGSLCYDQYGQTQTCTYECQPDSLSQSCSGITPQFQCTVYPNFQCSLSDEQDVYSGSCSWDCGICGNFGSCYPVANACVKSGTDDCGTCFDNCSAADAGCYNQNCPTDCDYDGGYVNNGSLNGDCSCGQKWCPATADCCTSSAPNAPTLVAPANGAIIGVNQLTNYSWNAISNWGIACPNNNRYEVCISSNQIGCDLVNNVSTGLTTNLNWTPTVGDSYVTWSVRSNNGSQTASSATRSFCVEGSPCSGAACGQITNCSGACPSTDDGIPGVPACGAPAAPTAQELHAMPTTINWTSGGALTDYYEYSVNGLPTVNAGLNLSASGITVAPGANNFRARAVNNSCGTDTSAWSNYCNFCYETGPVISSWTPALCGPQTRTCTENCTTAMSNTYTNDCAGVPLTQCTECPTTGAWSACDPVTHQRTRTVDYLCQVDQVETEDCIGTIDGYLFDASDLGGCPGDIGINPIYDALAITNQTFTINPLGGLWPVVPNPTTNADGYYVANPYVPGTYNFDFSNMINNGVVSGVRFECHGPGVVLNTVGQTERRDFGFWRLYNGWWQAEGGSVYAEGGVTSNIPASISTADQRLILADANGRTGVLSYGAGSVNLGTSPDVRVSDDLWQIQSLYDGLRYDYDFYDTRMDVFPSTTWDGGVITYNDGGRGFQIFRRTGGVTLNYAGPTGTQRVILLVDGNVTVNTDVTVPDGAFLGVIASGTINFAHNVTNAQGWFVAENITVSSNAPTTDVQFLGEGSFVGWTGIALNRSLGDGNNLQPPEKFTYRPDMVLNMPEPMGVYTKKFSAFIP